jgi:hypothetical protein
MIDIEKVRKFAGLLHRIAILLLLVAENSLEIDKHAIRATNHRNAPLQVDFNSPF